MSNPLKILRLGNPILRQVAKPFTRDEIVSSQTRKLVKEMKEKMIKSDGVGLAAPQIGINKQLLVVGIEEDLPDIDKIPLMALFNPKLEFILKHDKIYMVESCLSVPDLVGKVPRYNNVIVSYLVSMLNSVKFMSLIIIFFIKRMKKETLKRLEQQDI